MPETSFQRIVATALLIAAAVLIFLVVRETMRSDKPGAVATVARAPDITSQATTQATTAPGTATQAPAATQTAPARPLTRLVIVAAGGDSWLEVRAGSAQGKALYAGTLAQGGEVEVKAKQLWVRFGAASHLTAQLNGKPLQLRLGTYNAVITPGGLQLVAG